MNLMPRFHVLPNQQAVWDDLLVKSGVGEWVKHEDVVKHYEIIEAIVARALHRAAVAEEKCERLRARNVRQE